MSGLQQTISPIKNETIRQEVFKTIANSIPEIGIELDFGWSNEAMFGQDDYLIEMEGDFAIECKLEIYEQGTTDGTGLYEMEERSIDVEVKKVWSGEDLLPVSNKQKAVLELLIKDNIQC